MCYSEAVSVWIKTLCQEHKPRALESFSLFFILYFPTYLLVLLFTSPILLYRWGWWALSSLLLGKKWPLNCFFSCSFLGTASLLWNDFVKPRLLRLSNSSLGCTSITEAGRKVLLKGQNLHARLCFVILPRFQLLLPSVSLFRWWVARRSTARDPKPMRACTARARSRPKACQRL